MYQNNTGDGFCSQIVDENVCLERRRVIDERCSRDKFDISEQKRRTEKLEEMSIVMGQILEHMNEKLDDNKSRITILEKHRLSVLKKWETAIISSLAGTIIGGLISLIF